MGVAWNSRQHPNKILKVSEHSGKLPVWAGVVWCREITKPEYSLVYEETSAPKNKIVE